ncbi:MAG: protein kinase, partial [Bryobacteraceae bacterium]
MDVARWERIQEIFHHVSDLSASDQQDYLRTACRGDDALLAEIESMLEKDAHSGSLLDGGLPPLAQDLLDRPQGLSLESDFGPYQIVKPIGEGGMGIVYLARREDIGSLVAIKLLRDGLLSPDRRRRFASEQKTLAKLQHPFIAQIHDAGTLDDGAPWFVMEYVEGRRITDFC